MIRDWKEAERGVNVGRTGWGKENVWREKWGMENDWKNGKGGVRKGEGLKGRVLEELKERKEKGGIGGIGY